MAETFTLRQHAVAGALCGLLAVGVGAAQSPSARAQTPPIGEQEAHAIAAEAYLYLYPLVSMDLTRRQMSNAPEGKGPGFGPPNTFNHVPEYPSAIDKVVVRPNFDTLYSVAWLDLTKEPVIVSMPDTKGRYYLLPMLDMWTDVFAAPGWRTTGTQAQHFLVAPANWRPDLRERLVEEFRLPRDTQRLDAPTSHIWIIGRTKTDGPHEGDPPVRVGPHARAGRGEDRSKRRHEDTAQAAG
jgi:hypothetical protein